MPANDYRFLTSWRVEGDADEVFGLLIDVAGLPRWWPAAFIDTLEIQPGDETAVDRVVRIESKGWLPYTLRWHLAVESADRPRGFTVSAWGDFEGSGAWTFAQDGAFVDVTYDWRIKVNKPLVGLLSPLLRPLFESNHRWAMDRGLESLRLELARRRARDEAERLALPPPPSPVEAPVLPLAIGAAALLGLVLVSRRRRRR